MDYNIYCDESCHLPNDGQPFMGLGAIWCPKDKAREIAVNIREIKKKHELPPFFEIKWNKVSPAKVDFYLDLVDYFFKEDDLHFRALIANKRNLDHEKYAQNHDTWYYKMYFSMLKIIFDPLEKYYVYLDIKDTRSGDRIKKLHDVLCNNQYDFDRNIIKRVQTVRSHEVEQVQLADLLIGATVYKNRNEIASSAKSAVINKISHLSGYKLNVTTLLGEKKFNLFFWEGR